MEKKVYLIDCLTNMHVGSGETNFNIIDNQVQRDLITDYPTINSSSLKGALREFARTYEVENIEQIFGSKASDDNNKPGKYKFFSPSLLVLPVRSNSRPFFRATTIEILEEFISYCQKFELELDLEDVLKQIEVKKDKPVIFENIDAVLEDYQASYQKVEGIEKLKKLLGEDLAIFHQKNFKKLANNLAVIARNRVVNGKSENLWYEEVVPRESKFYFGVMSEESYHNFEQKICSEMVQIGANASVGYGYCELTQIGGEK